MAKTINFANFTDQDKEFFRSLKAVFVMAPREMSEKRLVQLVKEYLSKGNVVFGVSDEVYVDGFEGQNQFKMLQTELVEELAEKIAKAGVPSKLFVLRYKQEDVDDVIRAVRPNSAVVVRGSYAYPFHRRSTCALLEKRGIPFAYVSPFVDEEEALSYLKHIIDLTTPSLEQSEIGGTFPELDIIEMVRAVAKESFDYSFQTGVVLAEETESGFKVIDVACNEVVPYQTHALHFGNSREDHRAAHQSDAAHYDTIHAEMNLLVRAMKKGVSFEGMTLFINMMPCPSCARTLCKTGLKEVVYHLEHSDGYAVDLFEKAGIKIRRIQT